jgi:hypothetical protein
MAASQEARFCDWLNADLAARGTCALLRRVASWAEEALAAPAAAPSHDRLTAAVHAAVRARLILRYAERTRVHREYECDVGMHAEGALPPCLRTLTRPLHAFLDTLPAEVAATAPPDAAVLREVLERARTHFGDAGDANARAHLLATATLYLVLRAELRGAAAPADWAARVLLAAPRVLGEAPIACGAPPVARPHTGTFLHALLCLGGATGDVQHTCRPVAAIHSASASGDLVRAFVGAHVPAELYERSALLPIVAAPIGYGGVLNLAVLRSALTAETCGQRRGVETETCEANATAILSATYRALRDTGAVTYVDVIGTLLGWHRPNAPIGRGTAARRFVRGERAPTADDVLAALQSPSALFHETRLYAVGGQASTELAETFRALGAATVLDTLAAHAELAMRGRRTAASVALLAHAAWLAGTATPGSARVRSHCVNAVLSPVADAGGLTVFRSSAGDPSHWRTLLCADTSLFRGSERWFSGDINVVWFVGDVYSLETDRHVRSLAASVVSLVRTRVVERATSTGSSAAAAAARGVPSLAHLCARALSLAGPAAATRHALIPGASAADLDRQWAAATAGVPLTLRAQAYDYAAHLALEFVFGLHDVLLDAQECERLAARHRRFDAATVRLVVARLLTGASDTWCQCVCGGDVPRLTVFGTAAAFRAWVADQLTAHAPGALVLADAPVPADDPAAALY